MMTRDFLFSFYETPHGRMAQKLEQDYLQRAISVSCKQTIVQIGYLGFEEEFIDCELFQKYTVIDCRNQPCSATNTVHSEFANLPIKSESVNLVIAPHLLEFDSNRLQIMREIERILQPEGELIILHFNPLNIWVRLHFLWNKKMFKSWLGNFISRTHLLEWLRLLNLELKTSAEISISRITHKPTPFIFGKNTFLAVSYAVLAVKRQYTLIPLTPVKINHKQAANVSLGLKNLAKKDL